MKTQKNSKTISAEYTRASNEARALQADLLNMIGENLLTTWPIARGGTKLAQEILEQLSSLKDDSYYRMNPVCVNLLETLTKVCELQEKSYSLRALVRTQK